ncbi:MAG: hypothetical protein GWO16_08425 [Gammaproteobacteria bacterium]|nr:hypothetical protein [Gammaproteobacteria bacterium]NIR97973.1 hypothetical protein [Gammaproteobacteria bacterium]NIT63673.1 hypothetical protein [Gammaproteobacteria bacterium]NIV21531.1 hypothetical protein [Gammaproteobacteria bacterium]NIY32253.1 hypothetical protein [Gammaproteobacteria bacterium]
MKRLIVGILLTISGAVIASGIGGGIYGLPQDVQARTVKATDGIYTGGAEHSMGSCVSEYTRVAPGTCKRNTWPSYTILTKDVCTEITAPTASATGIALHLNAEAGAASSGGVMRWASVTVFSDASCTVKATAGITAWGYEFTAASAKVSSDSAIQFAVLGTPGDSIWIKAGDDAGNQGLGGYSIAGYTD